MDLNESNALKKGWEYVSELIGTNVSINKSDAYTNQILDEISKMENRINDHPYNSQDTSIFKGYIFEEIQAGTFNIEAKASGSNDYADLPMSNEKWSPDIELKSGRRYQAKVMATGERSAMMQALLNKDTNLPGYDSMGRLVARDQLDEAIGTSHRRALSNANTRPEAAASYKQTEKLLTDRIRNSEGIESRPTTKKEAERFAKLAKNKMFRAKEADITLKSVIKPEYIVKKSLEAGYNAALITAVLQVAPEIYKAIDYLIRNKKLDVAQLKEIGITGLSASAEGFIRGAVSSSLYIMCEQGVFGEMFMNINPTVLGSMVAITMSTIKDSILVAAGKITPEKMGDSLINNVMITGGYLIGAKIGGVICQAIGWEFPVVGYLLGSLLGTSMAALYNIGKRKLISYCIDTGFTCFGLVKQDYTLPDEVLRKMGINVFEISRISLKRVCVKTTSIKRIEVRRIEPKTIEYLSVGRGLIGVRTVGYIYN